MSSSTIEKAGGDHTKNWPKRKRRSLAKSKPPAPVAAVTTSSPSSSVEFSGIATEEEELELANSLILLSRGGNLKDRASAAAASAAATAGLMKSPDHTLTAFPPPFVKKEDGRRIEIDNTDDKVIEDMIPMSCQSENRDFTCKICSKSFGSFQALGGHKASHKASNKRPKLEGDEYTVQYSSDTATTGGVTGVTLKDVLSSKSKDHEIKVNQVAKNRTVSSAGSSKERAHVCQVCNAEFTSGQALGGHMRRHKPINHGGNASRNKKEKNIGIELDLNFPPLEQVESTTRNVQQRPVNFPFEGSPPTQLSLGSAALTNCLYG